MPRTMTSGICLHACCMMHPALFGSAPLLRACPPVMLATKAKLEQREQHSQMMPELSVPR